MSGNAQYLHKRAQYAEFSTSNGRGRWQWLVSSNLSSRVALSWYVKVVWRLSN